MVTIRPADFSVPADVDAYHAVLSELHREVWPDNPPRPREEVEREVQEMPSFVTLHQWIAWDGEVPVGVLRLRWRSGEDNQRLATAFFGVLQHHRGRGVASHLLAAATRVALDAGRTSLIVDSDSKAPEGGYVLERLGGKKGIVVRISRMDLERLDRARMAEWIAAGEANSGAFELLEMGPDRVPDEHVEAFVDLHHVMNSAPFEDLDVEPFVLTVEQWRGYEASRMARGIDWWATLVRHRESGELAGYTELISVPGDPTLVFQGDTAVRQSYRGRGLGRWLKASNLMRVLPLVPQARWVETGNAGSNRPMLAINEAMGFYPYKQITGWQFDVQALHDRVRKDRAA